MATTIMLLRLCAHQDLFAKVLINQTLSHKKHCSAKPIDLEEKGGPPLPPAGQLEFNECSERRVQLAIDLRALQYPKESRLEI